MLLDLRLQIRWIAVALLACRLQLLVDPAFQLIRVTLEVLEAARILQLFALLARLELKLTVPMQNLVAPLLNVFSALQNAHLLGRELLHP
uniref:Putative secreted protein n=1 Tax=Anopheles marajoara TaxID=58244 RepID=A0A2M4CA09_9DIPT